MYYGNIKIKIKNWKQNYENKRNDVFILLIIIKMKETLKNNLTGLDLKESQESKIVVSLSERIVETFWSRDLAIQYFAESMWSDLHEEWRRTRLREDGTYEPRMKKSKDDEWTQMHWTDDVDIANTKFEDLPSNWKYENLEAAKVAIELVFDKVVAWEEITEEMIEEMASVVHDERLKRNSWVFDKEYWNPVLAVEYAELPEDEKEKDRVQVKQAISKIKFGK